jgi:hypothetical protein
LVKALWSFSDLQIRYLREMETINQKLAKHENIDDKYSSYVYQLKTQLAQEQTDLRRKVWNSQIEISKFDFPQLRNQVAKTFLTITVYTREQNKRENTKWTSIQIDVLEANFNQEIKNLIRYFGRQIDEMTEEIQKQSFTYHVRKAVLEDDAAEQKESEIENQIFN